MHRVTRTWRPLDGRLRRVARLSCAAGAVFLALVGRPVQAGGETDDFRGVIGGNSACPEPQAVWAALGALVVMDRVEPRLRAMTGGTWPVEVTDLGSAFRVRAGDRAREYEDDARDCGRRAKLAAVFVALAADSAGDPTAAKPAQPPPAPSPPVVVTVAGPPVAPAPRMHVLHLEVAADARVAGGAWSVAPGFLAQLAWERGRLSVAAGARGSAPRQTTIGGVRVQQWRVGAQIAARLRLLENKPVSPFLELGAVAALVSERGSDLAMARAGTAGELGVVAGAGINFLRRDWGSALVLVEAELDPAPPTISAMPAGDVGRTPRVWLGAALGMSVGLF
jgi:hypothetical protein